MTDQFMYIRICRICVAGIFTLISLPIIGSVRAAQDRAAQDNVTVTEITPQVLVFATTAGNVVASVGTDGALLVGTPSADSTARITTIIAQRTRSGIRYVVIAPRDTAHSEGDAGWGRLGAFVAMHENALQRIGGNVMGPWIVTPDEIGDPYKLKMEARVNGLTRSQAVSEGMLFSFEEMIEHVTKDETLMPGEFIGSGTVGNGCGLELGWYLEDGDTIELFVEKIGKLKNKVERQKI